MRRGGFVSIEHFGKYLLQRKLAEGGMAELFLAKQTGMEGFEKLVVVKRILAHLAADESFLHMFLNEARVAARLNHPNVVQIFDLGKIDEQYFIAMEYVHGEDLRALIREAGERDARPPLALACRIVADTLAGLHYAHTRVGADGKPLGLVHRDVSPQNVIVTYEGTVKLVDFGIAKATRAVNAAQTQAGLLKGKYSYMAPEQARGLGVDARSDVFCAGVLLWELATWQRLFKRSTEMATLMAVAEEPIRAPRTVDPSIPAALDRLIVKALARDPDERFATALEMRAALEALIRQSGWESDALALSTWMRGLFAAKLRAQAADVAAAGLASLEDFLLTVEDKTALSWMEKATAERKTPSMGLPPSRPASGPLPATLYDDGPTTRADTGGLYGGEPAKPSELPTLRGAEPPLLRSNPLASTVRGGDPAPAPALAGVVVPSAGALTASPTAATAGVTAPPAPRGSETPSMNLSPADNPLYGADRSTAKRPAYEPAPPSPMRRIVVAGSAAALVAAVALTIALWPAPELMQPPTVASSTNAAPASGVATPSPAAIAAATAPHGALPSATRPAAATLQIHVDAPANITVDGTPQPIGDSATVDVQPGVEHVVTVQRPGHTLRKLQVPALAPGERMPLTFSVR